MYNIYYTTTNSFYSLDVYVTPPVSTLLFNLTDEEAFQYTAVYYDGTTPTVDYHTTTPSTNVSVYRDGVYSTVNVYENGMLGLVVDGSNNLYYVVNQVYNSVLYRYSTPTDSYKILCQINTVSNLLGLAINPAGDRIMVAYADFNALPSLAFMYPVVPSVYIESAELILRTQQFGAMWFACGDKVSIFHLFAYCVDCTIYHTNYSTLSH